MLACATECCSRQEQTFVDKLEAGLVTTESPLFQEFMSFLDLGNLEEGICQLG
jgi:hypothetical protein